jgi:hypothetical protein
MIRKLIVGAALAGAGVAVSVADGANVEASMWGCSARTVAASGPDYAYGSCYYDDGDPDDWARTQVLCSNSSGSSRGWWPGGRVYSAGRVSYAYCPSYQPIAKSAYVAVYD